MKDPAQGLFFVSARDEVYGDIDEFVNMERENQTQQGWENNGYYGM